MNNQMVKDSVVLKWEAKKYHITQRPNIILLKFYRAIICTNLTILLCSLFAYVVRCAIWYYWCNLKNVKNTHGGVLILVTIAQQTSFIFGVDGSHNNLRIFIWNPQCPQISRFINWHSWFSRRARTTLRQI